MPSPQNFYKRQIILSEVGEQGQKTLFKSHIIVIGAGGLGSPLLTYLSCAGIGRIDIYDFDNIEESNLHRQTLFSPKDIGKNKAICAKEILSQKNPLIEINAFPIPFNKETDLENVDVIIDCSDNFKSKFLAHDLAHKKKIGFCVASIYKFEGQVQFFNFKMDLNNCMRCLWHKRPDTDCVQTCAEAGVLGVTPGIIGSIQAMEVLKYILGLEHLKNTQTLLINLLNFETIKLTSPKNNNCSFCKIDKDYNLTENNLEITPNLHDLNQYYIISLLGKNEKTQFIPDLITTIDTIEKKVKGIKKEREIAIICKRGITSLKATKILRKKGYINCFSVEYGINSLY